HNRTEASNIKSTIKSNIKPGIKSNPTSKVYKSSQPK
ncbi:hypothetical protein LINPERHAP1_LOCUS3, partial [Linum perenne]